MYFLYPHPSKIALWFLTSTVCCKPRYFRHGATGGNKLLEVGAVRRTSGEVSDEVVRRGACWWIVPQVRHGVHRGKVHWRVSVLQTVPLCYRADERSRARRTNLWAVVGVLNVLSFIVSLILTISAGLCPKLEDCVQKCLTAGDLPEVAFLSPFISASKFGMQ